MHTISHLEEKKKRKNKKYIKKLCVPLIYRSDTNRHIGHKPIRIINMASFTIHRPNMWDTSFFLKKRNKKKKKVVQFHFYTFVHDFHFYFFLFLTLSPPTVRMLKAFQVQCPMSNICSKCTLTHTLTRLFIHSFIQEWQQWL